MGRRKFASWFLSVVMFVQIPLLSGCWSRMELEEQAFVPSIGLDKVPGGGISLTARIAIPSALGGGVGGGGGGGDKTSKIVSVQARTIGEAISLLSQTVERTPSFTHCSAVVFGESIAREGIMKYLRSLVQYREFRRTIFIFTAKGKAADAFKNNKPVIERSPTRYIENIVKSADHTGLISTVALHDFLLASETPHSDGFTMLIGSNQKVEKQAKKQEKQAAKQSTAQSRVLPVFGDTSKNAPDSAGSMKRNGGNPIEYIGTALYKKGKFITELDGNETQLLNMIRGDFKRGTITIMDPVQKKGYVTITTSEARPPKTEVTFRPDKMHPDIRISIHLEGDLFGQQTNTDFTKGQNRTELQKEAIQELESRLRLLVTKLRHQFKVDPMGIGTSTRKLFTRSQDFDSYDWAKAFDQANVHYDISYQLRRIGVQGTPPSVKER
ncbi:Ger(x)C family spore germination protein [Fodinisporobacter ferrooxydans]|uniref:Ger(X)C family spore germination protein n=1 Tax=Fodinisporobacter ferrooxydans TaxID=2901836 RepID=A0ABY4CW72_9BACL|nr:Ger(x)C family spore germination protein [Alicyclobacillaceae bacterium MYW30-H2]